MKKKIVSVIAVITMLITLIPSAFADNSIYIGSYYTGNTDGTGYAAMDIITCTDSSITIRFKRIKDDVEKYTYTFDEGTVSGDTAVLGCHIVNNDTGSSFDGTAVLTLNGNVKVQITSSLGGEMYTGNLPKVANSSFDNIPTIPQPTQEEPVQTVDVKVYLNETPVSFEDGVKPVIMNDHTYVPLRSVFSGMGINVFWDEYQKNSILKEQLITCTKNDTIIQFARTFNDNGYNVWSLKKWVNSNTMDSNYTSIDIADLQPTIINSRSYVPLRVISEAFGAVVEWEDTTKTVYINCDTNNTFWYNQEQVGRFEDFLLQNAHDAITQDYSAVVPESETPYFRPDTKFYVFKGTDQWGNVKLVIAYDINAGGVIDSVVPDAAEVTNVEQRTETNDVTKENTDLEDISEETSDMEDVPEDNNEINEAPEEID
ncbi:MAG: copper amine oxidase N-terminal domain-containing protein [Oscillospiraceae bacterium]|nr:copper amine oxidase N-terminal domain-containing protein [Oscillospiraceae bacterium]